MQTHSILLLEIAEFIIETLTISIFAIRKQVLLEKWEGRRTYLKLISRWQNFGSTTIRSA